MMDEKQVIKALECCTSPDNDSDCPLNCPYGDVLSCQQLLLAHALALFKQKDEQIFQLENRLKECENGYEGTLHLERCKLHDAEQKIKKLTEQRDTFEKYAYSLRNFIDGIAKKESEGYEPSAAIAAAEMDIWRCISLRQKQLEDEIESLRATVAIADGERKCRFDVMRKSIAKAKANFARELLKRVKKNAFPEDGCGVDCIYVSDIEQYAKEIVEGEE